MIIPTPKENADDCKREPSLLKILASFFQKETVSHSVTFTEMEGITQLSRDTLRRQLDNLYTKGFIKEETSPYTITESGIEKYKDLSRQNESYNLKEKVSEIPTMKLNEVTLLGNKSKENKIKLNVIGTATFPQGFQRGISNQLINDILSNIKNISRNDMPSGSVTITISFSQAKQLPMGSL